MIDKQLLSKEFIARLTIYSDPQFIPLAQSFVLNHARMFQFPEEELKKIELITEEAVLNTIENSFDEGEIGTFDLKISYKPGLFILSIEDKGIPVDAARLESQESSALGLILLKNLTDEFHFINLGRDGKRIEIIKSLPEKSIQDILGKESAEITASDEAASDSPQMRIVNPEDAPQLSRLAYRVYGYTYSSVFYYPEKIKELIENQLIVSAVSINEKQEIVGNLSLFFEYKGAPVADSGAAMVDPRYRGHSLFKQSKIFLKDYAIRTGMYGIYSEAVTIHSFTQQGNISLGAKETGIMLAYAGQALTFKKIGNEMLSQRQAVVLYYLKTNEEPHRQVYLNRKFYPILNRIYQNAGLNRDVICVDDSEIHSAPFEKSRIELTIKSDLNIAVIRAKELGEDATALILANLKELCLKKIDTIYVELSVHHQHSAKVSNELNKAGFMLSGIVPELDHGDIMKLQYLNNVFVDPEKIVIAAPLAKEFLEEIFKDYR